VYSAAGWGPLDWASVAAMDAPAAQVSGATSRAVTVALPRRGELALARARAFAAAGRLRDALAVLERVRATDPERVEADRLRGEIQLQLLALTSVPARAPVTNVNE
jgi:hypothetical protein